jgi:CheY-like chemotaxis protein
VRRLCEACAVEIPVTDLPESAHPPADYAGPVRPRVAPGCKACNGSGFKGRLAVMELVPVEGQVPRLIETGATQGQILEAARPFGLTLLWEGGLARCWAGLTSYEEIRRVLGETIEAPTSGPGGAGSAMAAPEQTQRQGTATDEAGTGATILLADDDAQMRRLVRTVLEREGFRVLEAEDGLDTLEAIDTQSIDLILLDHDMPRLTGLGVLEELRARVTTASLPVIMLTARTDDTESEALELGAQDYLTKPVQPRSLVARVRAVLKRSRMG